MPIPKRPMPEGFREYLETHTQREAMQHFCIGWSAAARFTKECGLSDLMEQRRKMQPLAMPADFPEKAQLSNEELIDIYGNRSRAIFARWRREAGQVKRRVVDTKAPMPDGFQHIARTLCIAQLCARYKRSKGVIKRWMNEAGIVPQRGRPFTGYILNPPSKVQDNRPDSLVTRAQTYLQSKVGPVFRKNGGFYVNGSRDIMSPDDMVAFAIKKHFSPDEWRKLG